MSKKKSETQDNKQGLAKYRSLIILSFSFFALVAALSGLTFYASKILAGATQELEISAQQTVLVQQVSKNLLDLNLHLGDVVEAEAGHNHEATGTIHATAAAQTPAQAQAQEQAQAEQDARDAIHQVAGTHAISELPQEAIYKMGDLEAQTKQFTDVLNALKNGGTITDANGKVVQIEAVETPELRETLQRIEDIWLPYLGLLNNFAKDSQQGLVKVETSNYLVDYTRSYNIALQNETIAFTNTLNGLIQDGANKLRIAQIAGVVLAFVLFLLIVFGSLRRLQESDALTEEARKETQEILETVSTGLFLLDKDLAIGHQHSKALEDIVGTNKLAGAKLASILRNRISDKDLQTAEEFIQQLYNPRVKEKLVNSLNPLSRVMFYDGNNTGESRYLDFKFSRVYSGKDIARILVNVEDVSDEVRLEQRLEKERAQNDMQIEMLTTILNVSPRVMNEFITNTQSHIEKMNNVLKNPGSSQFELEGKLKSLYREMHSLKGEASALKLHSFTKIATEAEDKLHLLQNQGKLSGNDFLPLTVHLDELLNLSNTIEGLGQRIASSGIAKDIFEPAKNTQTENTQPQSITVAYDDEVVLLKEETPKVDAKEELGDYLVQFGRDIAERQKKQITVDVSKMAGVHIPDGLLITVRELCIQLLRNAIVHGIADSETRVKNGKNPVGTVTITCQEYAGVHKDSFLFIVEDDGQGIDYDLIRQRLAESGKYSDETVAQLNNSQLLNTLFASGFSTKEVADEDGGRGVGLDIVKERVKEHGGKINVQSEKGKFSRFIIKLPMKSAE